MTTTTPMPAAPSHLPDHIQKRWTATHQKAHAQAKVDIPGNEPAQRAAALKAANALLAVPAPSSASDIDTLEEWQVLKRDTRTVKGKTHRVCVTSDGRKYSHPVTEEAEAEKPKQDAKAEKSDESGKRK